MFVPNLLALTLQWPQSVSESEVVKDVIVEITDIIMPDIDSDLKYVILMPNVCPHNVSDPLRQDLEGSVVQVVTDKVEEKELRRR